MATMPVFDFVPDSWVVNDQNYLVKWNNSLNLMTQMQAAINTFGEESTQELVAALEAAEATRQQAINDTTAIKNTAVTAANTATTKAGEASDSAAAAQQARDEAQQIAVGEVAITELQPGTLTNPKDYVSVDAQGALVKRNLSADVSEQLNSGEESASLTTYALASIATTTTLDFSTGNSFRIDASGPITLVFANIPATQTSTVMKLNIYGAGPITWPAEIDWDEGETPTLEAVRSRVLIDFDNGDIYGSLSMTK